MTWRPPRCWQPQHDPTPPKFNLERWGDELVKEMTWTWTVLYTDGRAPCYCDECRGELRDPVTRRMIDIDRPDESWTSEVATDVGERRSGDTGPSQGDNPSD